MIKTLRMSLGIILVAIGCFLSFFASQFIQAGSGSFVEPNIFFLGLIILIIGSIAILYDFRKSKNIFFIAFPLCLIIVFVISNAIYVTFILDDGYNPNEEPFISFVKDDDSGNGWLNYSVFRVQFDEPIEWSDIELYAYAEYGEKITDFEWSYISDYTSVRPDDKICIQIDSCDRIYVVWGPSGSVIYDLNCD